MKKIRLTNRLLAFIAIAVAWTVSASSQNMANLPLQTAFDAASYQMHVEQNGISPVSSNVLRSPYGPEDSTVYNYTGFNIQAGLAEDGSTKTGGLVNFNVNPFACDTVSSDNGVSPYSYVSRGKLYCFLPNNGYTAITRTIYDANTLERLDQRTFQSVQAGMDRMPYLMSYDDTRDVVWVISFNSLGGHDYYYLNILDTATCQLQRVGYLGEYSSNRSKGNFSPKAFLATGGTLRILNADDKYYLLTLDPTKIEFRKVGYYNIPFKGTYGVQPMVYDANSGRLLINHYDFYNGTQYYEAQTFVPWGQTEDSIKATFIENAPTGFTMFYKRPETENNYHNYIQALPTDYTVTPNEDGTSAKVSLTIPSTDQNGNEITIPSWSSNKTRLYVYVDNNYTNVSGLPTDIHLGDQLKFNIDMTPGMHVVTVQTYPFFNEVKGFSVGKTVCVGYDAPDNVCNATFTVDGCTATITWDAPTQGRFADFGSTFDPSDLTYTVVRNSDGAVIAENITVTTATDSALSEEIHLESYTIYAYSHEQASTGATTPIQSVGLYLPLPYINNFDTDLDFNGFTVINANNDGINRTWQWNRYYYNITSGWGQGDDWAITPALRLEAGKLYSFAYKLHGNGDLNVTIGKDATVEGQTEELENYKSADGFKETFFRPTENGTYYLGFHNYNAGNDNSWNVDSIVIKQVSVASAPERVRNMNVIPDAQGALGATVSFKLPTVDIAGNTLTEITKAVVTDEYGIVIAEKEGVAPGAEISLSVSANKGFNHYRVVAVNADGEGWPVVKSQFVGPDVPKAVYDLVATWGDEPNVVHLSWNASEVGVNGGYLDPSTINYVLYKYDSKSWPNYTKLGECGNEHDIDVSIMDADVSAQDQYIFAVNAINTEGESEYTRRGIVLGKAYKLPFFEPMDANGMRHAPWITVAGPEGQNWTVDNNYYSSTINAYDNDGAHLTFVNKTEDPASGAITTPIIDFANSVHPMLKVWVNHAENIPAEAYVNILASTDGNTFKMSEVAQAQTMTGNSGWTEHIFDLSALAGKKAQVALNTYVPNAQTRVFADNISIVEAEGNDIAVAAISKPFAPVVGDTVEVSVTVTNRGSQVATDYSVLFNVNDETIDAVDSEAALAAGASATYTFTLPISAGDESIVYNAQVIFDDDNADNNNSEEVELSPRQIDLHAPQYLTLDGIADLSWVAPAEYDGREVTLDFEDVPSFINGDIAGWKNVDVDQKLTTGFILYYNNPWPHYGARQAWMTWNIKETGYPNAEAWFPYGGDRCLIHWGALGQDEEGRPDNTPDDDWFISPEIKGGTTFSFMTAANDLSNVIEIRTSSTTDDVDAFTTLVKAVDYTESQVWKEVSVTLPADAKYVALRCTQDGFGTRVDDIKYTLAESPVFQKYNVYADGKVMTSVFTNAAQATMAGKYAVSAVYNIGESALSNVVDVATGIKGASSSNVKVSGLNGRITVVGAEGKMVNIYTSAGALMMTCTAQATVSRNVNAGVYLVTVDGQTYKVVVR